MNIGQLIPLIVTMGSLVLVIFGMAYAIKLIKRARTNVPYVYHVALNKGQDYIPGVPELANGKRNKAFRKLGIKYTLSSSEPETTQVSFDVPVDQDGNKLEPFQAVLALNNFSIDDDAVRRKIAATVILQLVTKEAATLVYSTKGVPGVLVPKDVPSNLTEAEEEMFKILLKAQEGQPGTSMVTIRLIPRLGFDKWLADYVKRTNKYLYIHRQPKWMKVFPYGFVALAFVLSLLVAVNLLTAFIFAALSFTAALLSLSLINSLDGVNHVTLAGTGLMTRVKEYRNYYLTTTDKARYGVEQRDVNADLLPWGLVFDAVDTWVNVFAQPFPTDETKIVISGNLYAKVKLAEALAELQNFSVSTSSENRRKSKTESKANHHRSADHPVKLIVKMAVKAIVK